MRLPATKKSKRAHSDGTRDERETQTSHSDLQAEDRKPDFCMDDAKSHLMAVDPRFETLFDRLVCKPFESTQLERIPDPFQSLCTSILGQQVSAMAARSITHRFIRLYVFDG